MSAVAPPDPTYTPSLPESIAKRGILSDAQLENIIYAGQAHAQTLPDGTRKGFFIGDGTGVGKGRQIAGIIMVPGLRALYAVRGNQIRSYPYVIIL